MEDWSNPMNESDGSREIFLYGSSSSSVLGLNCSSGGCFRSVVKTESTSSTNHGHGECSLNYGPTHEAFLEHHRQEVEEANKAKIMAHPRYSNLLQAFLDCHKVGAPPEVMERLAALRQPSLVTSIDSSNDPELDQFMEAYCNMLVKYKEELTTPFQEAMDFTRTIETQLQLLTNAAIDEKCEGVDSSEEYQESGGGGETRQPEFDPRDEDGELKNQLMKKYSGCLSSLRQEFSKKRKIGKLPKEARQKLLNWWELHYKWPYPSEKEKVALAESTGLDEKQINNWFINQRKRHWKPTEDKHFMVMDAGLYRFRP